MSECQFSTLGHHLTTESNTTNTASTNTIYNATTLYTTTDHTSTSNITEISNATTRYFNTQITAQALIVDYVTICLQLTIMVLCIFGNLVVFIVLFRHRKLRQKVNLYLVGQSLTDTLIGVIFIPYETVLTLVEKSNVLCTVHIILLVVIIGSSLLANLLLSIDRHIILTHPLSYQRWVTPKVRIVSLLSAGTFIIVISLPVFARLWRTDAPITVKDCNLSDIHTSPYAYYYSIVLFIIVTALYFSNVVFYITITRIVLQLRRKVVSEQCYSRGNERGILLIAMYGVFNLCWLPFLVTSTMLVTDSFKSAAQSHIANRVTLTFGLINSGINCFIYVWKNEDFRHAITRLLHGRKRRQMRLTSNRDSNLAESQLSTHMPTRRTELTLIASVVLPSVIEEDQSRRSSMASVYTEGNPHRCSFTV